MKDYYKILDVQENSSQEDIKASFRKLAMKWHPDRNNSKEAEDKFKEVNEAYLILGDVNKRKEYDQRRNYSSHSSGGKFFSDDPDDLFFKDFFSQMFAAQMAESQQQSRKQRIQATLEINFWESIFGTSRTFNIKTNSSNVEVKVIVPKGINNDEIIKVETEHLTVFFQIHVQPENNFLRDGLDIYSSINIPYTKAVLGGEIEVNHWSKKYNVKIPAGIQPSQQLRIVGAGVEDQNGYVGDFYLVINIFVPKEVSAKERQLLEALAKGESKNQNNGFFNSLINVWNSFKINI